MSRDPAPPLVIHGTEIVPSDTRQQYRETDDRHPRRGASMWISRCAPKAGPRSENLHEFVVCLCERRVAARSVQRSRGQLVRNVCGE